MIFFDFTYLPDYIKPIISKIILIAVQTYRNVRKQIIEIKNAGIL